MFGRATIRLGIGPHSSIDFVLLGLFSCVFVQFFFMRFIHFCRAFLYIAKMRFHHQLMRFHKTAHQTWHCDRGPRARSCTSKTFGGLIHSFAAKGR